MKYKALSIGIPAGVVALLLLGVPVRIGKYAVNIQAQDFAKVIVENDWPPETCRNLFMLDIGPRWPTVVFQESCFYEVAHRRKDPTVCEFLIPSEYGLNCIGKIWGKITDESNCHWYQDNAVRCFEGEKLIPRIIVCEESAVKNLPDECLHRIAFKKKDPALCKDIENSVLRSVCEVRINTWNKYPEVRSTQYFSRP